MNIEYLDTVMSACHTLRMIKKIYIEENGKIFKIRAQIHPMIISPFGTGKSAITSTLDEEKIFKIENFTRASIEGSISKDGDYIPSVLTRTGGKLFIIDEWNSIDFFGQTALLGILENQQTTRSIGFKVKSPYNFLDNAKRPLVKFIVNENLIYLEAYFSCIAYAMEFPIYENSQKAKALLSRFSPLFIEPTKQFIRAVTKGEFTVNVDDQCHEPLERIFIKKDTYNSVHDKYFEYIEKHKLFPIDSDEYGFVSRTLSEIIRYGTYNYIKQNNLKKKDKEISIDNDGYFTDMFDYIHTIMLQFTNPETKGKLYQYKKLTDAFPNEKKDFYAKKMGASVQTLFNWDKKLK